MLVGNLQIFLKWKENVKFYTAIMHHKVGGLFFPFHFILGTLNYFSLAVLQQYRLLS